MSKKISNKVVNKSSNKNNKCYYFYERKEPSDEEMKKYREDRKIKNEKYYSGKIVGAIEVITPLYTEGQKLSEAKTSGNRHEPNRNKNKLSLSTTFKSQIRITTELMAPKMSKIIFGDLEEKSKVEFVEKEIIKPRGIKKEYKIKIPDSYAPQIKKDMKRLYFNQTNRIQNLEDHPADQIDEFQSTIEDGNKEVTLHNVYIPKTKIKFDVHFDKLSLTELVLLVKALILKEDYYHQIGYGKNYGMGTIKVQVLNILSNAEDRFKSFFSSKYKDITKGVLDKANETIDKSMSKPEFITYKKENKEMNLSNIYNVLNRR